MTWKKVDEEKKIISTSMPAFMSDRDIIEQIYDNGDAFEVPKEKSKPIKSIFTNLFLPSVNSPENVGLIQKMIEEKEFEKVLNYQPDYIWAALKNIH